MSETKTAAVSPPASSAKSKTEQAHHIIQTISMTLGIAGAIGAAAVWVASNVYLGEVEVRPDKPVQSVIVKVYDKKGQESSFHMNHFQLMPGSYHLEVTPDGSKTQHADIEVQFSQKRLVPVMVVSGQGDSTEEQDDSSSKHHWWQFWRH